MGGISRHTLWANAIPMYNVKFRLVLSGTLRSKPIKIHFFSRDSNICVPEISATMVNIVIPEEEDYFKISNGNSRERLKNWKNPS